MGLGKDLWKKWWNIQNWPWPSGEDSKTIITSHFLLILYEKTFLWNIKVKSMTHFNICPTFEKLKKQDDKQQKLFRMK